MGKPTRKKTIEPSSLPAPSNRRKRSRGVFHHYTTATGLIGIVQEQRLFATNAFFLNDAAEVKEGLNQLKRGLAAEFEEGEELERFFYTIEGFIRSTAPHIFCLSGDADDLSQWRAYGGSEGGYSIGFDVGELERDLTYFDDANVDATNVIYLQQDKDEIVNDAVGRISRMDFLDREAGRELITVSQTIASRFKNEAFFSENEWRIVAQGSSVYKREVEFRNRHGVLAPYLSLRMPNTKLLPIRTVMVGPHSHAVEAVSAVEMLLDKKGHKNVDLRISAIPFRRWQ